jgi:hypothetical protein
VIDATVEFGGLQDCCLHFNFRLVDAWRLLLEAFELEECLNFVYSGIIL